MVAAGVGQGSTASTSSAAGDRGLVADEATGEEADEEEEEETARAAAMRARLWLRDASSWMPATSSHVIFVLPEKLVALGEEEVFAEGRS